MGNKGEKAIYVSVAQLAQMLGISRVAVFNKIKKGQIPAERIGRSYAISMEHVNEIVSGRGSAVLTEEKKKLIKAFTEIKLKLVQLFKNPYERKVLEYFDFISWLESKIEKRSFAEIVKEKAESKKGH